MSQKQAKKIRKAVQIATVKDFEFLRNSVNKLTLKSRIKIAWKIIKGKW